MRVKSSGANVHLSINIEPIGPRGFPITYRDRGAGSVPMRSSLALVGGP